MSSLTPFLRLTTRAFRRAPSFFLISIFTLAVGIGANAAIFTVVNAVLLRPLSYPEPERIVSVAHTAPGLDLERFDLSDGTYLVYDRDNRSLEDLGIYWSGSVTLTGGQGPERVGASGATASVFSILRVPPSGGRALLAPDENPGAEPVVVLSHDLWRRRFGGDPAAIGALLPIDGRSHRIVGIMPAGFHFPSAETELWVPMTIDPSRLQTGAFNYAGIGRLRPGQTPEQAAREISGLVWRITELPDSSVNRELIENAKLAVVVHPLRDAIVGDVGRVLWLLLGSVGLILLIACANVANLFLVRAEGRVREVAVRSALGAPRGHIMSLFLSESLMLAAIGGALGLFLAIVGVRVLIALRPEGIPRLEEVAVDGSVLAFTVAVALLAGVLVGLLAALRYGRPNLAPVLKEGGRGGTVGRERLRARNALAIVQVALALILLIGAGLMVKSFWRLRQVDPGVDPHRVLTARLDLPEKEYPAAARPRFVAQLLDKVRAIPGVQSAGTTTLLPLTGEGSNNAHTIEDFPLEPGALPPILATRWVSSGYFATLRIPVLEGKVFERPEPGREAVVSAALARHFWPHGSALGKRLSLGVGDAPIWSTIVGVVGDVRDRGLDGDPVEAVYYPMQPQSEEYRGVTAVPASFTLVVRGGGDPLKLIQPVREAVWSLDANLPLSQVRPLEQVAARSIVRTTFTMLLLVIAAGVALLLGGVGIYGVISYMVSQRTREIGVRMALGADRPEIARLVLRDGFFLAGAGILLGLIGAFLATRLMVALLYGVSPTDLATFTAVPALLAAIALFASWVPARQAAAVPPLEAIRRSDA